jgi:hypothetical protein
MVLSGKIHVPVTLPQAHFECEAKSAPEHFLCILDKKKFSYYCREMNLVSLVAQFVAQSLPQSSFLLTYFR